MNWKDLDQTTLNPSHATKLTCELHVLALFPYKRVTRYPASSFTATFFQGNHTHTTAVKMTRGESVQSKVHYKGANDDFLVFIDDVEQYSKWLKGDTSIPLAQFMSSFRIFLTHR